MLPLFFPLSQIMHPMYEALSQMTVVYVGGDQGDVGGVLGDPYVLKKGKAHPVTHLCVKIENRSPIN